MAKKNLQDEAVNTVEAISPKNEQADITETKASQHSRCGGVLKSERLKQGLSLSEVCTQLRLSASQVEAMENDAFSQLPQPSIARGFIRNYAKVLKIDPAPIIAVYQELNPDASPQSLIVKSSEDASVVIGEAKSGFSLKLFTLLITLFALIAAAYFYYTQHIKPKSSVDKTIVHELDAKQALDSSANVTEFALPPAERNSEVTATAADSTAQSSVGNANDNQTQTADSTNSTPPTEVSVTTNQPTPITTNTVDTSVSPGTSLNQSASSTQNIINVQKPVTPEATLTLDKTTNLIESNTEPNASAAPANVTKPGEALLQITTTDNTWVNVVDANGREVFSEVLASGIAKSVSAKKPLQLTIGNAPATTLTVNGEPFDLTSKTRNKVAKIRLK